LRERESSDILSIAGPRFVADFPAMIHLPQSYDTMEPLTCPVCEQRFRESDDGVAMPFCSQRCKMIDAARWLDERYGLPVEKPMEDGFSE